MVNQRVVRQLTFEWRYMRAFLVLVALVVALAPGARAPEGVPRAQPALLTIAAQHPETRVAVIVQKLVQDSSIEDMVAQMGGVVTTDLHIINAFAADLPAGAVVELARAAGVRWISLDAPVANSSVSQAPCKPCVSSAHLQSAYIRAIKADQVWNEGPKYLQGQGIGVAVVDSGLNPQQDMNIIGSGVNRIVASVFFNGGPNQSVYDGYGHGNHVAGIIGGNGDRSGGAYVGVAPMVNLINVKVSDDDGVANASNVVKGLQWINDNRNNYNIRVVNISLNNSVAESYNTNPIDAAVEILWFNKVVVVVSAGNKNKNALYPPANDPFAITVGAADDRGTTSTSDDVMASYSGYGTTSDGFAKPDLVAPGSNIISLMANPNSELASAHSGNIVSGIYFKMSGTSMAAPVVSGAIALLLQDEPALTPDQVKYRLKATARAFSTSTYAGAGYLDVYAAVHGTTTASANTGTAASHMLWTGSQPLNWGSANWNSANWNSANWNSANWNSVNWSSANWNSDYWGN
jgi:serine protease AprX